MGILSRLFLLLGFWYALFAPANAAERVAVPEIGFAMLVPDGWQRISAEDALAHLRNVRLDREEFQSQLSQSVPTLVSLRRSTSSQATSPIVNVLFRPMGPLAGHTPIQILESTVRVGGRAFNDFEALEGPREVSVSGLSGAFVRVRYTQTQAGLRIRSVSEYWVVPRGGYYFAVSVGYEADTPAAVHREIAEIVSGITIDHEP